MSGQRNSGVELAAPLIGSRDAGQLDDGDIKITQVQADNLSSDSDSEARLLALQFGAPGQEDAVIDELDILERGSRHGSTPLSEQNPASRARAALRRAARKVVFAQRMVRTHSSKGVPLMPRKSMISALRNHSLMREEESDEAPTDNRVRLAATFVRDALANRSPNTRLAASAGLQTAASKSHSGLRFIAQLEHVLGAWYYRFFFQLVVIMHCLLAFWENIPPSVSTPPFTWTTGVIELLCLLVYTLDQVATFLAFGMHYYVDKKWESVFLSTLLLSWLDWIIYYPSGHRAIFRLARPFRPLLGITKRKSLRRLLSSILWTVPRMLDISLLLFIVIFFYAALGQQIFSSEQVPGYSENNDNFDSWPAAALGIFILTTTENYPNIANEAFRHRPAVATIFFVSALFVMLWLILPLILAIVYDHYLDIHKKMVRSKRVKQYLSLVFAYQTLMSDGDKEMDRQTFIRLVQAVRPIQEDRASVMFDALDVDESGKITIAEFLRLPVVLRLNVWSAVEPEVPPPSITGWGVAKFWYAFKLWSRQVTQHRLFHYATAAIIVLSCCMGGVWTLQYQQQYDDCICKTMVMPALDDNTPPSWIGGSSPAAMADVSIATEMSAYMRLLFGETQEVEPNHGRILGPSDTETCVAMDCEQNPIRWSSYISLLLAMLQVVELFMRMSAHQASKFGLLGSKMWIFASLWNIVDVVVVLWSIIGYTALLLGVHEHSDLIVADWFEVCRALPFLRLLSIIPRMREILQIIGSISGLVLRFVVVYCGLSYGFAIIGMGIVGGVSQTDSDGLCQNCQMWSYETFPFAWLALLQLTVGNNWNSILYPNIVGIGTRWAAWYFMLYRFFMTDVFMNVIEGVMIETYCRREEELEREKEAVRVAQVDITSASGPVTSASAAPTTSASSINSVASPIPTRIGISWRHELFDEISAEDNAEDLLSPKLTPKVSSRQAPTPTSSKVIGVTTEELQLLEAALRKQEARLESLP